MTNYYLRFGKVKNKKLEELVKNEMENAIKLKVKLSVSHDFGSNWYEVK